MQVINDDGAIGDEEVDQLCRLVERIGSTRFLSEVADILDGVASAEYTLNIPIHETDSHAGLQDLAEQLRRLVS